MLDYLFVMLGGAIGTAARFWLSEVVAERFGQTFPLGTLVINITGSFVIGFFATLTDPGGAVLAPPRFRLFFTYGLCGGYTTFSSFSLQTLRLAQDNEWRGAGWNAGLSLVLCLAAVWLGDLCARWINQLKH
jgi:CrcB protein